MRIEAFVWIQSVRWIDWYI